MVLSLIGQRPARRPQCGRRRRRSGSQSPLSLSPQFVGGGFGGWYLPSSVSLSLSHSPTLKRQLESSGSLTINGIRETRTVREGMTDNDSRINSFRDAHGRPSDVKKRKENVNTKILGTTTPNSCGALSLYSSPRPPLSTSLTYHRQLSCNLASMASHALT